MSSPTHKGSSAKQTDAPTVSPKKHQHHSRRRRQTNSYLQNQHRAVAASPMISSLPTPPAESSSDDAQQPQDLVPFMLAANADVPFPPNKRPLLSYADKIRAANVALVHSWGRFLTGTAVREICDDAALLKGRQVISIIDLPANFCMAPADELICPSDDPTRLIAIVSNAGLIIDVGMYNFDGPVFYSGFVIGGNYTLVRNKSE
ncbi:hypothetical protein LPJ81_002956 [Coemansia sp. IMI 209127]|nr:hypothetical protein LPJ81_002956 [Coemansia sp. IMI 209127]